MEYIGDILYDENLLNKKLIIFGAGLCGKKILHYLDLNGAKENVICFCDSNLAICGMYIENIPVLYTKNVFAKYGDADYLVSGKYSKEIYHILKKSGIQKIHMFVS